MNKEKTIAQKDQAQKQELFSKIWKMCDSLRGSMDANEFKDIILPLMFYRFASEYQTNKLLQADLTLEDIEDSSDEDLKEECKYNGYYIEKQYLFSNLVKLIKENKFENEILYEALASFGKNAEILGSDLANTDFEGNVFENQLKDIFKEVSLDSSKLGKSPSDRKLLFTKLINGINDLNIDINDKVIDVFGDAYEYLIGEFAASAGKKGGEFYTPQQVSNLLSQIVTCDISKPLRNVCDPTCGSGALLLQVCKRLGEVNYDRIYGQEKNSTTSILARMNLLIHNVSPSKFTIYNDDTLTSPLGDMKQEGYMDIVVANPPFSLEWSADKKYLDDPRFANISKLPPKSYADYAFVLHMIHSLSKHGRMAVVLPHGPLFRGNAEKVIRDYLVKNRNLLDTVIGLPANLFFGTSIPTCICVFRKDKENDKSVYFIDASKHFEKGKNQNILRDEDIQRIMDAYQSKKKIEKFAHLASFEELEENDFNLNIPRYVDTSEEEEEIDINETIKQYRDIVAEEEKVKAELNKMLEELGLPKI